MIDLAIENKISTAAVASDITKFQQKNWQANDYSEPVSIRLDQK